MAVENSEYPASRSAAHGRAAYPIPLNGTTTVAFLGRTERGPADEPVIVASFAEYCRFFGGNFVDGALSHAVHDFFLHGGRRAVIVRVTNRARRAVIEVPAGDAVLRLEARHPGRQENLRVSIDYELVESQTDLFNFVVQRLGAEGSAGLVEDQEFYPKVSVRREDPRFIGTVLDTSRLVRLAGPCPLSRPAATPPERPGDPVRYIEPTTPGDDGDELTDYDIIGSTRDGTGLFSLLRGPRIDVLAMPLPPDRELGSTAFVAAARFCEHHRALLIWDPPGTWQSVDSALLGVRQRDCTSGNIVTYFPRVRPRGARVRFAGGMPACGAIAGMLAQRSQRGLWGGDDAADYMLRAALTPVLDVSAAEAKRLARYGVNAFVQVSGGLTRLAGRVTLGAAGLGSTSRHQLDRRRLSLFILNSIADAAAVAAGDPDRGPAASRLEQQVERFLGELAEHGAFAGRSGAQGWHVDSRVDSATGTPVLRFGFALDTPGQVSEYSVRLDGPDAAKITRLRAVEAGQLFG